MGMIGKEDRISPKAVLHAALTWKKQIDASVGRAGTHDISKPLYDVIEAFELSAARERIEHEVFDDPHIEDNS